MQNWLCLAGKRHHEGKQCNCIAMMIKSIDAPIKFIPPIDRTAIDVLPGALSYVPYCKRCQTCKPQSAFRKTKHAKRGYESVCFRCRK